MNKFFKLFFALSAGAFVALAGCDLGGNSPAQNPQTPQDTPALTIKTLEVSGDKKTYKVDGAMPEFTVKVTSAKITVQVTPEPADAKVTIDGVKTRTKMVDLKVGSNAIKIVVSKGKETKECTLTADFSDEVVGIQRVTVKAADTAIEAAFDAASNAYSCSVSKTNTPVTVAVVPNDAKATVLIDGKQKKEEQLTFTKYGEQKTLKLVVKNQGREAKYDLLITCQRPQAGSPYLKSLKLTANGKEIDLSPAFAPTGTSYTAAVPSDVAAVAVVAEAASGIRVRKGNGPYTLAVGKNVIKVETEVEDAPNTDFVYTITVTKAKPDASSDASLKDLKLHPQQGGIANSDYLTEKPADFNPATLAYSCTVSPICDQFAITATAKAEDAHISVKTRSGQWELATGKEKAFSGTDFQFGENTFEITVTAPDARTKKTYTVKATKSKGSAELIAFSGTGLADFFSAYKNDPGPVKSKSLETWADAAATETVITAKPEFPESTTMKIAYDRLVKVKKTVKDKNGKLKEVEVDEIQMTAPAAFTDSFTVPLLKSGATRVELTVTSSAFTGFGHEAVFYLAIKKPSGTGKGEARLKTLEVSHYVGIAFRQAHLNKTFSADVLQYTVMVPSYAKDILVKAEPLDPAAQITGWGGSTANYFFDLPDSSVKKIEVVASNGDKKVYELTVKKYPPAELTLNVRKNTVIDVQQYRSGYTVSGTFTNPEGRITSIYVGASAFPIAEQFKFWTQAKGTPTTFTANFEAIKELPNGMRDLMVIGYDNNFVPVAVKAIPIVITGNTIPTANVNAEVRVEDNRIPLQTLPEECTLDIFVYDYSATYANAGETVIYSRQDNVPVSGLPMTIPLAGVPVGKSCKVQVAITSKRTGHRLYYGVSELEIQVGASGATPAPVTARKVQ